jgi:hypothetical protein
MPALTHVRPSAPFAIAAKNGNIVRPPRPNAVANYGKNGNTRRRRCRGVRRTPTCGIATSGKNGNTLRTLSPTPQNLRLLCVLCRVNPYSLLPRKSAFGCANCP